MALVNAGGQVVEFLSYERHVRRDEGPRTALTSMDIGVVETGPSRSASRSSAAAPASGAHRARTRSAPATTTAAPPPAPVASVTVAARDGVDHAGRQRRAFTATALRRVTAARRRRDVHLVEQRAGDRDRERDGVATAVQPGDVTITATAPNGVAGHGVAARRRAANPPLPATRFSEIHYDNVGTDAGEAIEIEGPAGTILDRVEHRALQRQRRRRLQHDRR